MDIEKLISDLLNATYREPDSKYGYSVISTPVQKEAIVEVVRTWANSQPSIGEVNKLLVDMAKLEAKVFAYEAIISNSNFKPILSGVESEAYE